MSPEWTLAFYAILAVLVAALVIYKRRPEREADSNTRDPWPKASPLALAVFRAHQAAVDLEEKLATGSGEDVRIASYAVARTSAEVARLLDEREKEQQP